MTNPYPFTSVSLCGGKLRRTENAEAGMQQFAVDHPDGIPLMLLHLEKSEAKQWATVLAEYAEATK